MGWPVAGDVRDGAFPAAMEGGVVGATDAGGDGVEVVEAGGERGECGGGGGGGG